MSVLELIGFVSSPHTLSPSSAAGTTLEGSRSPQHQRSSRLPAKHPTARLAEEVPMFPGGTTDRHLPIPICAGRGKMGADITHDRRLRRPLPQAPTTLPLGRIVATSRQYRAHPPFGMSVDPVGEQNGPPLPRWRLSTPTPVPRSSGELVGLCRSISRSRCSRHHASRSCSP